MNLQNYYSGLSGIALPIPKYQFPAAYQNSSRLTYYSTFFNSIEVNSSFYKIPMKTTITRWSSTVHSNFRFTFKLYKEITHNKGLNFDRVNVDQFLQTILHIGLKRACLLVQFPPSLTTENIHQLDDLLNCIKVCDPDKLWNVAVEFRNKSWYNEGVYDLLASYEAALVIQDIPKSATPSVSTSAHFMYVRFHGPTGNYGGSYSDAFLSEYASYIKEWLSDGRLVYVYFNNTKGDAFNNLITLNKFVLSG